jgi:tetratricopeptide (TPR) repeat protein
VADDTQHDEAPPTKREGSGKRPELSTLDRGSLVGRYVVIDQLGKGGMGVVYAAFDPELDRKVAIKLLQAGEGSTGGSDQAWLLREAQAMARLAHPNVIAVHDVGSLPGHRVFVAMELVDGETLRAWTKVQPRTWREVIGVMRQAGAGLAAAHHVGLVHRDFKPDNVLVGNDGRVRVMDFGLARLRADDDAVPAKRSSDLDIEVRSPLTEDLTIAGAVVGTPAYMAPELYKGEGANARSDQFSFGVALYEALFRVRPYNKGAFFPAPQVPPEPRTPPADSGVPARITKVVMRAIAVDPKARFASMDELLAELAVDPIAHRRRLLIGAGAMLAAIAVGVGGFAVSRRHGPPPCEGIDQRLAGVWDAKTKAAVKQAFTSTHAAFGVQAYAAVERAVDAYAVQWTQTATESCRATRIRGDQSEAVLAIRQACLDERLAELGALTKVLADADAALVEKGDKAVWQLEPVAECSNVAALLTPAAVPPALQPKVSELRRELAEAKAQVIAGRFISALAISQKAIDTAAPLKADGVIAEAQLVNGTALILRGSFDDAQKMLADAVYNGIRSRRDDVVAGSAIEVSILTADTLGRPTEGQIWLGVAGAVASHLNQDHMLQHRLLTAQGVIAAQLTDFKTAIDAHEKALVEANLEYGKDSPALWADEEAIAATMSKAGLYTQALPHFERALSLREHSVGPDHPDVALLLSNMGTCYQHAGDAAKARAMYQRALAIREKAYGANSPMLIATLNNMADQMKHSDPAGALPMVERSLALATKYLGPGHVLTQTVATTRAEVLGALGRSDEAHTAFDELIAAETKSASGELATTLVARAELALAEKHDADAADYAQRAVTALEAAGGKDNPELWHPLSRLGEAKLALGQRDAAKAALERALAIADKAKISETDLAATRAAAAQLR